MSLTSHVIDPHALSTAAKSALIDELYATHDAIFDGVSRAEFAKYVVDSPAERTRIEVYFDTSSTDHARPWAPNCRDSGRVVGYFAVHTFVRTIDGERWVVVRAEKGKLPSYRGNAKASLMLTEVLRACLLYPRARKAYLGCFVHPSAYLAMGRVAPKIYPHPEEPTPAPVAAVMNQLAQEFGLDRVDDAREGVRKVGWITRESAADRQSWARRTDALTRFYCETNPGYRVGHGLVTLVPIDLVALIEGSLRHALRRVRRLVGARPVPALASEVVTSAAESLRAPVEV